MTKPARALFATALFVAICRVPLEAGNSVSRYGAVGDGIHDDTRAIQQAIDRQPRGAVLDFGAGDKVYMISRQLVLKPEVHYAGAAIIRMSRNAPVGTQIAVLRYGSANNVSIDGLTFDSNGVGGGIAIDVLGGADTPAMNLSIHGVTFRNTLAPARGAYDAAIYDPVGLMNGTIADNKFIHCGSGVSLGNADHVRIAGNRFEDISSGDAIFVTFSPNAGWAGHGLEISSNTGTHLGRMAIEVWAEQPTNADGVLVRDNSFDTWNPDVRGNGFGISIMTGRRAVVVNNNLRGVASGMAFGLEMGAPGSIVEGNRVEGFSLGIALHRGNGTRLTNNQLIHQEEAGIQITNAPGSKADLLIQGNTIVDAKRAGIWSNSEQWSGSQVLDNSITRAAGAFPDDSHIAFVGIATTPPLQPVTITGNTVVQSAPVPVRGFSFTGIQVNGGAGANAGSQCRANTVKSASRSPFGAGLLVNAPGSADGVVLEGNHFEGLASVIAGAPSPRIVLRGNTALNCASRGTVVSHL